MQFLCKHIKIRTREPSKVVVKKGNSIISAECNKNSSATAEPTQFK